jgi:hypothetical protein
MGWVVNTTPRPLYPRERPGTHYIGGCVDPRAGLDGCGKSCPHRDSITGPSSSEPVTLPMTVAEGLCARAGALCGNFIGTLTCARHAVKLQDLMVVSRFGIFDFSSFLCI